MTIHDPDAYMRGIWDWAILDGCFGTTRIKPTDLDGIVERNGNFLVLETKSPGASIPDGQKLMFKAFVKQGKFSKNLNVIIVIWGENGNPEKLRVYSEKHPDGKDENGDINILRRYVSVWFDRANNHVIAANI